MFNVAQERASFVEALVLNAGLPQDLFNNEVLENAADAFERIILENGAPIKEISVRELLQSPEVEAFEAECYRISRSLINKEGELVMGQDFIDGVLSSAPNNEVVDALVELLEEVVDKEKLYGPEELFDIAMQVGKLDAFKSLRFEYMVCDLMNSLGA